MNDALTGRERQPYPVRRPKVRNLELPPVNIATIGATGFRRNLQDVQSTVFSTSLYEIDYLIEKERTDEADDLRV